MPDTLPILAVDTCQGACSVAVCHAGAVLAARREVLTRGHAEHILPMTQAALAEASIALDQIGTYALTLGPGSFTGVRVGLSFIKGLNLVRPRPTIALTGFEAVAAAAWVNGITGKIDVVLKARGAEVFHQTLVIDNSPDWPVRALSEPMVKKDDDPHFAQADVIMGNAVVQVRPNVVSEHFAGEPDAAMIGLIAACDGGPQRSLQPLYIKAPDIRPASKTPPWVNQD